MTDEKEVLALYDLWNKTLQTRNPDDIAKLYADDANLWGTFSPDLRPGQKLIHDYFRAFMERENLGSKLLEHQIRIYDEFAINSGRYSFQWTEKGKDTTLEARFSFIYRKVGGQWLIVEHHSSTMPER